MAVTQTARMDLTQWSTDADPLTREQVTESFAEIEDRAVGRLVGLAAARPAASAALTDFVYRATDTGALSWCTGAAWVDVVLSSGATFTGPVQLGDNEVRQPRLKDYSEVYVDRGDVTGAVEIDVSAGNVQRLRAIGNVTLSFINWPAHAVSLTLILVQDATGGRTWTFPAAVKTSGAAGLGLSSTSNSRDRVVLMTEDAGVTIDAAAAGKAFA